MKNRVAVLHGVNLGALDRRPAAVYGGLSFTQLEQLIERQARELGLGVHLFQTDFEGEFVQELHKTPDYADGLILNPGAWTHYSYAIRDALEIAGLPAVEVHLSDIESREEWRRHSVIADLVNARVHGKGADGYQDALALLARELGVEAPPAA